MEGGLGPPPFFVPEFHKRMRMRMNFRFVAVSEPPLVNTTVWCPVVVVVVVRHCRLCFQSLPLPLLLTPPWALSSLFPAGDGMASMALHSLPVHAELCGKGVFA